ncbi:MAG: signal peptidase I [Candidatus Zixiibacteriota bacterium]
MSDIRRMGEDFLIRDQKAKETSQQIKDFYERKHLKPLWREYVEVVVIALVAATLLRVFVVSAYRVSSSSMEDTLLAGDYIFVNKLAYKYREPNSGDIVVFEYPLNRDRHYIKRVAALPGQTVEIIDKVLYVDGLVAEIPPDSKHTDGATLSADLSNRDNFGPLQIPLGNIFVLGDNRDDSRDSRFWGMVPMDHIKGRAIFVYWSWEPSEEELGWSFPYIHIAVYKFGTTVIGFPTRTRWDRLALSL